MATVAAGVPVARTVRFRAWWIVGVVGLLSSASYLAMRVPTAVEMHRALATTCAELAMRPGDWPCEVTVGMTSAVFLPSSLLIALGLALPCLVLVAAGRRIGAFLPLLVPVCAAVVLAVLNGVMSDSVSPDDPILGIWEAVLSYGNMQATYWSARPWLTTSIDAALIAAPVATAAFLAWRSDRSAGIRRGRRPVGAAAAWLAAGIVGTGIVVLNAAWTWFGNHAGSATRFVGGESWVPVAVMTAFGVMLGTHRRWWPWVFVPVALLLSAAIPTALAGSLVRMPAFFAFAGVASLTSMGVMASASRPLAEAFGRERTRRRGDDNTAAGGAPVAAGPTDRPRLRPIVVANGVAGAILAFSMIAAVLDPLPITISTVLPTYLGQRAQIEDVRARGVLGDGLEVIERYHTEHDTFRGFDPELAPGLRWLRRSIVDQPRGSGWLGDTLELVRADRRSAEILTLSQSGAVLCARTAAPRGAGPAVRTWGRSETIGPIDLRVEAALAACGDRSLDASAFQTFPVEELCPAVDDGSLVLCRSVQMRLRDELAKIRSSSSA